MGITSVTAGGQQYQVAVSQEDGVSTVKASDIAAAVKEITPDQLDQVERALLKQGFTIKLPSGASVSSEQQLDALKSLESIGSSDFCADAMDFMKIFAQCQQLMRQTARTERAMELSAQVGALNDAANAMKAAADKRLAAGIAQGVAGIVGGCVQIGAGITQIGLAGSAFKATSNNDKVLGDLRASQAQAAGQIGTGISGIVTSMGGIVASTLTHAADMEEVKKTRLETEAKVHETGVQHANEMMQSAEEIIRDMKEKMAALQQAQTETTRGIARNI